MLLLYILSNQDELKLSDDNVEEIVNLLINFFVRRNLTDIPNTRKLTQLFIDIITDIKNIRGTNIISVVHSKLKEVSASDAVLEEKLNGAIYDENPEAARYVLCTIESQRQTKEIYSDLWSRDSKNKYVWTIDKIQERTKKLVNILMKTFEW